MTDASADEPLARGTEVGRFIVLWLVGKGGMGEVYAAHDPELDRKVAIKLLRGAGRGGRIEAAADGRARLMREAQAIAKVSHPNVVVVYDVGTYEGRVFIAMELIDGHTLGYWMQIRTRTVAEILEVFAAAGRGLAAAHEKELIHRDFKPENVMVGADGQVRVMDFGLVRVATDRDKYLGDRTPPPRPPLTLAMLGDDPLSTRIIDTSSFAAAPVRSPPPPLSPSPSPAPAPSPSPSPAAMTPVTTAAPTWSAVTDARHFNLTQAGAIMGTPAYMSPEQFRGIPTDARADQFSFCVTLYEALYGARPFGGALLPDLAANVLNGRIQDEPQGRNVPAPIRRALLRGLSSDPDARFPSMTSLLAELLGDSALAGGARRFADGAAAKLAGVWEAPEGDPPADTDARTQVQSAFLATGKPYAAATFEAAARILDRFARRWTELYIDTCAATHLRGEQSTEILDLRMAALDEALGDLRALCREFRQATADTVENAVQAANALGALERCADVKLLRAIIRPPDDPGTRAAVDRLQTRLSEVRALSRVGRFAEGLKAVVALESAARVVGYAPLLAEILVVSGLMHLEVSDLQTATRTLEDAVWTAELCRHDEVVAQAATNLVYMTGHAQSRFDAGEIWSRHAETVLRRMGGHELYRGWLYNNRGAMRATQGRLRDAIEDLHRAIAAKQKALGADDPDVGLSIGNAAIYLDELGETVKAAEYAERAVKIVEATLGLDHPRVAVQLANYAELLNRLGRFEEALKPAERALAVFERETDPEGLYVTYPLAALGFSHMGSGRHAEAVPPFERVVRIREAKENVLAKVAEAHFGLGRALWGAGQERDRALALAAQARSEYARAPATPATQRELGDIDHFLAERPPRLSL